MTGRCPVCTLPECTRHTSIGAPEPSRTCSPVPPNADGEIEKRRTLLARPLSNAAVNARADDLRVRQRLHRPAPVQSSPAVSANGSSNISTNPVLLAQTREAALGSKAPVPGGNALSHQTLGQDVVSRLELWKEAHRSKKLGRMAEPEPEPELQSMPEPEPEPELVPEAEPELEPEPEPEGGGTPPKKRAVEALAVLDGEGVPVHHLPPTPPTPSVHTSRLNLLRRSGSGSRVPAWAPPSPGVRKADTGDGVEEGEGGATMAPEATTVEQGKWSPPERAIPAARRGALATGPAQAQTQRSQAQRLASQSERAEQHAVVERLHRQRRARQRKSRAPTTPRSPAHPPPTLVVLRKDGEEEASTPPSPPVPDTAVKLPSLFVVDWDDTILPTSLLATLVPLGDLARMGSATGTHAQALAAVRRRLPPGLLSQMEQLETAALRGLERIVRTHGKDSLVLVTNAAQGWVQATAKLLMPTLNSSLLEGASVRVVYARPPHVSRPSQCTTGAQTAWKLAAFAREVSRARAAAVAADEGARLNLISMGDSEYERLAMKRAATRLGAGARGSSRDEDCDVVKTVKFMTMPEAVQLRQQWEAVWELLPKLGDASASEDTVLRP